MRTSLLVYMDLIGNHLEKINAVEVGVYKGDNAVDMLEHCPKICKLYLIDSYSILSEWFTKPGGITKFTEDEVVTFVDEVKKRFAQYDGRVELIIKDSVEASKQFDDKSFHYVYIDGAHDYESVGKDLKAWYPKVKDFGMLGGHDALYLDVAKAVANFALFTEIPVFTVNTFHTDSIPSNFGMYGDWWIWKYPKELEVKL